jgi:hypothetical protein
MDSVTVPISTMATTARPMDRIREFIFVRWPDERRWTVFVPRREFNLLGRVDVSHHGFGRIFGI